MSDSDETLDELDEDFNSQSDSPSILTGVAELKSTPRPEDNVKLRNTKRSLCLSENDIIPDNRSASPEYFPSLPKVKKFEKNPDDLTSYVASSCSFPSTQDECSQLTSTTQTVEQEDNDDISAAHERVVDIERQTGILERLKSQGISVKGSKQFIDLKQKLIQVRMLLTGLTLSQDIDILNASKQDVAFLTSKQTRLLDLFTRCKDVVNKIQSLKRGATTTINEEQGCNQVLTILPGLYSLHEQDAQRDRQIPLQSTYSKRRQEGESSTNGVYENCEVPDSYDNDDGDYGSDNYVEVLVNNNDVDEDDDDCDGHPNDDDDDEHDDDDKTQIGNDRIINVGTVTCRSEETAFMHKQPLPDEDFEFSQATVDLMLLDTQAFSDADDDAKSVQNFVSTGSATANGTSTLSTPDSIRANTAPQQLRNTQKQFMSTTMVEPLVTSSLASNQASTAANKTSLPSTIYSLIQGVSNTMDEPLLSNTMTSLPLPTSLTNTWACATGTKTINAIPSTSSLEKLIMGQSVSRKTNVIQGTKCDKPPAASAPSINSYNHNVARTVPLIPASTRNTHLTSLQTIDSPGATSNIPPESSMTSIKTHGNAVKTILLTTSQAKSPLSTTTGVQHGTGSTAPLSTTTGVLHGTGRAAPLSTTTGVQHGTGRAAPLSTTTGVQHGTGRAAPLSTTTDVQHGTGRAVPLSTTTGVQHGTGRAVPLSTTTGVQHGTGRAAPLSTTTCVQHGTGRAAPLSTTTDVQHGTGRAVPLSTTTCVQHGTGRAAPLSTTTCVQHGTGSIAPLSTTTCVQHVTGSTAPLSTTTGVQHGTGRAAPLSTTTDVQHGTGRAASLSTTTGVQHGKGRAAPLSTTSVFLQKPDSSSQGVPCSKRPAVDVITLLRHKVILPGIGVLSVKSQGRRFEASLRANGHIESTGGEVFPTPMAWLKAVTGSKTTSRQAVAYNKIFYKDRPLSSFKLSDDVQNYDQEAQARTNINREIMVQHKNMNSNINSSSSSTYYNNQNNNSDRNNYNYDQNCPNNDLTIPDLAKLLQANCKVHLISDNELIPTASFLPKDFWSQDFDITNIDPKLLDF